MGRPNKYGHFIKVVADDALYSASTIAHNAKEMGLLEAGDKEADTKRAQDRARKALGQIASRSLPEQPDGVLRVEGAPPCLAWYGWRWKLSLPDIYFTEAEREHLVALQQAHQEQLTRNITASKANGQQNDAVEASPPQDNPKDNTWLGWRSLTFAAVSIASLAVGIFLSYSALYNHDDRVLDNTIQLDLRSNHKVAVLPCSNDELGALIPSMIVNALSETHSLRPLPTAVIKKKSGYQEICSEPDLETMADLTKRLEVPFLLWGKLTINEDNYSWAGSLYHKSGIVKHMRLTAPTSLSLADNIARTSLRLTNSMEEPLASFTFFSHNTTANILYSEALELMQAGNMNTAIPLLRKAGGVYDPDFYLARIKLANALYATGSLKEMEEILVQLAGNPNVHQSPRILIRVYKALATLYYKNYQIPELKDILLKAQDLTETDFPNAYLFFLRAEGQLLSVLGDNEAAAQITSAALDLANLSDEPEARVYALLSGAIVEARARQYVSAIGQLKEARRLAAEFNLENEAFEALTTLARIVLRTRERDRIEAFLQELEEAEASAGHSGNAINRIKIAYWIGYYQKELGSQSTAIPIFERVFREASDLGILEFELKSGILLFDHYLEVDDLFKARELIEAQRDLLEKLPPRYAMWVCDRSVRLQFRRQDYETAVTDLNQQLAFAKEIGDETEIAKVFNTLGAAYHKKGQLHEAEKNYLRAYDLQSARNARDIKTTLQNIIGLYQDQGDQTKINHYSQIMKTIKQ